MGSYVNDDGKVDIRKLVVHTVLVIAVSLLLIWIALYFIGKTKVLDMPVVRRYGKGGVVLYCFFCDMLITPLTIDVLWPLVVQWPAPEAILLMAVPSALGGFLGYWIGRLIGRIPFVSRYAARFRENKWGAVIVRYGAWGVFLGALTPIPFTTTCWTAGILKVGPLKTLAACAVGRLLRMTLYYFLVAIAL